MITHEIMLGKDASRKKNRILLKATTKNEEELDKEEIILLTRKFKRFFNKNTNVRKVEEPLKRAPN